MTVFANEVINNGVQTVNNGVQVANNVANKISEGAEILSDALGVSSIIIFAIGLYLAIKLGKKVLSAILIVVALIFACMFFFGKDAVNEVWIWFSNTLGLG